MTKDLLVSRRAVIASGIALGVSALAPMARAAAPLKVAGAVVRDDQDLDPERHVGTVASDPWPHPEP